MTTVAWLESLHALLLEEERDLALLVTLALREQEALILSDTESVTTVSNQMLAAAGRMELNEVRRESLLADAGFDGATLSSIVPLAQEAGLTTFTASCSHLMALATELRQAQERNARLLLGALRVRERWANLLASMGAPTYAASGHAAQPSGPIYLSKSA